MDRAHRSHRWGTGSGPVATTTLRRRLWISHSGAKTWDTPVNNRGVPLFCAHFWLISVLLRDRAAPFLWAEGKGRFWRWVYRTTSDTDVSLRTIFQKSDTDNFRDRKNAAGYLAGLLTRAGDLLPLGVKSVPTTVRRQNGIAALEISSKSFPFIAQNAGDVRVFPEMLTTR